jgi:hypothetical protein
MIPALEPRRVRLTCASPSSRALHMISTVGKWHMQIAQTALPPCLFAIHKPYQALTLSDYWAARTHASDLAPCLIGRYVPYLPNRFSLYYIYTSCSTPIPHLVVVPVPAIVSTAKKFMTGFSFLLSALKMSWANSPPRMAAVGANSCEAPLAR